MAAVTLALPYTPLAGLMGFTPPPLAYLLARWKFRLKFWVELLIDLPVVLPPSVAGLGLAIARSPAASSNGPLAVRISAPR